MARKPNGRDEDHVVDLRRYRQSAERARKAPPPSGRPPKTDESFLGPRANAGLILAGVVVLLLLLTFGPALLHRLL
ncbi:MAG: hypothetical protein ABW042_03570 [Phenylobacterium sp.]